MHSGSADVARLGRGDVVGEIGLVARRLRTATVTALTDLETLAFPRADFQRLREESPAFDAWVSRTARQRLAEEDGATTPSPGLDTVVLDVDGTLVDSVYVHVDAWARAFAEAGVDVPSWRLHRAIGMGADRLVTEVAGEDVETQHGDRVRDRHDALFVERIDEVRPLPGAADLLAALGERSVTVVVASSGNPDQTQRLLEAVGGPDVLESVVTSADAEETKPAPDLVDAAVESVRGDRALVVGDAVWDMEAARQVGRPCVGLLSGGFGEAELRDAGATWVYDDPADLVAHLDDLPLGR